MKTITGLAPGKINLTLDIFPKKERDAFHEIKSIAHKISLADELTLSEYDEFMIEGNFHCHLTKNLIWKAFELLQKFSRFSLPPVRVKVVKNIPLASGLGGGSSDFAAFVKLYTELFELGSLTPEFVEQSGQVGKDIPFFFEHKNCSIMEHFGEKVSPLPFDFSGQKIFLFFPPFPQSTAEAYEKIARFNTDYTEKFLLAPSLQNSKNAFDEFFSHDRYQITTARQKEIHMAGSGSAFWSTKDQEFPQCKKVQAQLL